MLHLFERVSSVFPQLLCQPGIIGVGLVTEDDDLLEQAPIEGQNSRLLLLLVPCQVSHFGTVVVVTHRACRFNLINLSRPI